MPDAVICEPLRTPVGGFGGSLRDVPVQDLASAVIRALMERTGLPPEQAGTSGIASADPNQPPSQEKVDKPK